jgi:membrane protein DedA with SNARE-associated domain
MIEWVTDVVAAGGLLGVFALMLLENLFPPIPSEVIMPFAGFAAARGDLPLGGVIVAGLLGTLLGNAVWFELARAIGADRIRPLTDRFGPWFGVEPADMRKAEATLKRYGPLALSFGRLLPAIRTVISIPAGLVLIPRRVFYLWTTLGSLVWTCFLALLGYGLRDQYLKIEGWIDPLSYVVLAAVLSVYAWHLLRVWKRRQQGAA